MIGRVSGRVTGLGKAFLIGQAAQEAQADIEDSRESSGFGQVQRGREGGCGAGASKYPSRQLILTSVLACCLLSA